MAPHNITTILDNGIAVQFLSLTQSEPDVKPWFTYASNSFVIIIALITLAVTVYYNRRNERKHMGSFLFFLV